MPPGKAESFDCFEWNANTVGSNLDWQANNFPVGFTDESTFSPRLVFLPVPLNVECWDD